MKGAFEIARTDERAIERLSKEELVDLIVVETERRARAGAISRLDSPRP